MTNPLKKTRWIPQIFAQNSVQIVLSEHTFKSEQHKFYPSIHLNSLSSSLFSLKSNITFKWCGSFSLLFLSILQRTTTRLIPQSQISAYISFIVYKLIQTWDILSNPFLCTIFISKHTQHYSAFSSSNYVYGNDSIVFY